MIFNRYIDLYKESLQNNQCSARTIEIYLSYVGQFMEFLVQYYPRITSVEKITKDIIFDYQSFLLDVRNQYGKVLANKTRRLKLTAVKSFFNAMIQKDYILKNPADIIKLPKEEIRLKRPILTEKEVFTLLESIKLNTPINIRNRAIIELLYSCGIRTKELCNLKLQDVDLNDQTILVVQGKGNRTRLIPMGQYAVYYIELYLNKSRKHLLRGRDDPSYLFLSRTGCKFCSTTVNSGVIRSILRNFKVNKYISCYTFRHTLATHLLANKVDITYIAQLLGHASLKSTQCYTKVEISDLKKMHTLYHPREKD